MDDFREIKEWPQVIVAKLIQAFQQDLEEEDGTFPNYWETLDKDVAPIILRGLNTMDEEELQEVKDKFGLLTISEIEAIAESEPPYDFMGEDEE